MKREILEKSYADALDAVIKTISSRKVNLDERHLLIVPDIYTFALEKRLFLKNGGAFDLEVTTFNRLHKRLDNTQTALSKQGAIMLLKKICLEKADELSCFSRSSSRSGFAVKLYDTIVKLRSCSVLPSDLKTAENLPKAHDVALLYDEFLKRTQGEYIDASGRITLLREKLKKENYVSDCHVYIALYDTVTAEMKKLLSTIEKKALSLTIASSLPVDNYIVTAPVEVIGGVDRVSQYKLAAKKIKEFVLLGGNRYGDVCVIDEDGDFSVPRRIFSEYKIPYYANEKLALGETELARFIFTAIDAKRKGYKSADMAELASNWYSGINKDDSDAFNSYIRKRCVDYLGFTQEFTGDEEEREQAEKVRKRLMSLVEPICVKCNTESFLNGVKSLLNLAKAQERTEELCAQDGRDISSIYDKTMELIDLVALTYSGVEGDIEELSAVLKEGLDGTTISLVPNENDTVQIGPLAQFRGSRPPFAVVIGFNDGVLPAVNLDDGLINDFDATKLEEYSMKVAPKTNEMNELCTEELWHFLKSAKKIFITYSEAEGDKPSYELKKLMRVNGILAYSYADYDEAVKAERNGENIARYAGSVSGAAEMALIFDSAPYQASLKEAVGEENLPKERKVVPFLEEAKEIFLKNKATSVSALQTYFDCPFKYFISYALSVKKAKDGKVEPVDIGLLLHKIVEKFVESGMPEAVTEFVEKTAPLALDEFEKYRYKTNEDIFLRLKCEAVKLCTIVAEQVKAGSFKPIATEFSFGKSDSTLETITYPSGVRLMGEIDRIDEYKNYARVIDYKTGRSKFDYNDLYFGRKIQLMIYMQVLRKNGYLPAGVFYFPSAFSWGDDEFSHRLCGPFNVEKDLLTAFDRALTDEAKSSVIEIATKRKKDGEISFRHSKLTCTQAELEKMCDYAEQVAGGAIEEIARGVVDPSPASSDRSSACDYCDYYSICGGAKGKERYTSGVDKTQIVGDEK